MGSYRKGEKEDINVRTKQDLQHGLFGRNEINR
jgi:hypothetical protein